MALTIEAAKEPVFAVGRHHTARATRGTVRLEYLSQAKGVEPRPAEVADQVVEQYATGDSGLAIAATLGLKLWRVYGVLQERGALRTKGEAQKLAKLERREGE